MGGVIKKFFLLLILNILCGMTGFCQDYIITVPDDITVIDNFCNGSNKYVDSLYDVEEIRDVIYSSALGYYDSYTSKKELKKMLSASQKMLDLKMDIYKPVDGSGETHPTILFFHGGAFFFDSKESPSIVKWCKRFAARGYVTVSINYRMAWPMGKELMRETEHCAVEDAISAVRFLVSHKKTFAVDADNIYLAGTSAGSMMALQVPLYCPQQDFTIRAIANMWGAVPDTTLLTSKYPPLISFHGGCDVTVPPDYNSPFYNVGASGMLSKMMADKKYGSIPIHQKLNEEGVKGKLFYFPTLKHKLHWDKQLGKENKYFYFIDEKIAAFFLEEMKR